MQQTRVYQIQTADESAVRLWFQFDRCSARGNQLNDESSIIVLTI